LWYATAKITHATILKVQAVQGVSGIRVVHIFDPIGGTERKDFGDFPVTEIKFKRCKQNPSVCQFNQVLRMHHGWSHYLETSLETKVNHHS